MEAVGDQAPPQETQEGAEQEHDDAKESEIGRPSTPKWWRPPVPPETYKWEEVRRQRQKGGYPWTHLNKDDESDTDEYLDDNLYEPVNPPPLYGNESYLSKDLHEVPQPEDRMIEIPPEMEILTSEGLDGLDKPDPNDNGFDGDREWQNLTSEDEQGPQNRSSFTAGLRKRGEAPRPRSTTPKSVGFSPDTITHEVPSPEEADQEVPEMHTDVEPATSGSHGHGKRPTAFDILKSKAADAADQMKQRIKQAIPVRPKWQGGKKSRKRRKTKQGQDEDEELENAEDAEMKDAAEGEDSAANVEKVEEPMEVSDKNVASPTEESESAPGEEDKGDGENESKDDEKKKKKAEEKLQQQKEKEEKEKKKQEEKLAKQKAAEEVKKAKLEEKLAKAREAEEQRQAKAEEEKKKQLEKEEAKKEEEAKKAAEKAAKEEEAKKAAEAKKEEDARKAAEKAAKEEEARKVAEAKKAEEDAKKAAEKAAKEEERKAAEEAKKAANALKEEERKAAEAAKEEERKAAEVKKAEEKKAAEAKKEEEKKAADAKKEEEKKIAEAKKEDESTQQNEDSNVAETPEQVMDITEAATENVAENAAADGDEAIDANQPQTPSGTTKRRYIKQRKNPMEILQIPNPITSLRNQVQDFKNKLKRSRTPPRRQAQRKQRRSRSADASRSPPREPGEDKEGSETRETEMETNEGEQTEKPAQAALEEADKCEVAAATQESQEAATESVQGSSAADEERSEQASEEANASNTGTGRKRKQPAAKEKLDKLGAQLKGLGVKSMGIASQASKEVGQKMKGVGKDLQKLGTKVNEKCQSAIGDIKAKQEAAKGKGSQTEEQVEEIIDEPPEPPPVTIVPPEVAPPKRTFRFKRRNESQEEGDDEIEEDHVYENAQELERQNVDEEFPRRLLGRADRDWESPLDRAHSRDVSEEPFSGNVSSRGSPPGSSMASSTMAPQVRRPGVLEEIDSDEFFLRERGISEGEDEEEVNRLLVEELRQAFRPTMSNALAGFDIQSSHDSPPKPDRSPRKPPRKDRESDAVPSYQTFPPERPKRKQPQGYVSKFMKEHEGEEDDYLGSNEEVHGSTGDINNDFEGSDIVQMMKDKLSEIDRDVEEVAEEPQEQTSVQDYEDDGRYEPISEGPVKPARSKRKQPKRPPTPPSFYYNTIAANEWLQELEGQIQPPEPDAPVRKRRGSGKSASLQGSTGGEDTMLAQSQVAHPPSEHLNESLSISERTPSAIGSDAIGEEIRPASSVAESGDYVDEAGYAIVQKDREAPRTMPRKKKKRTNQGSLQSGQSTSGAFFSLPRASPHQVVPPARPHRTYSTVTPKRPPRSKSGSRQSLDKTDSPTLRRDDEPRPSTAIGIMQGRPLPPPPRPQRSPAPLNDLDHDSIERALGVRHYANFEDLEPRQVEELFTASNIPYLGRTVQQHVQSSRMSEMDMACQTDPVPDDEFIVGSLTAESPVNDSSRIRLEETSMTASSRLGGGETQLGEGPGIPSPRSSTPGDVSSSFQTPRSQPPHSNTQPTESFPPNQTPSFVFPTRLHLEQLEVDFLRVNDLNAQSIRVQHLQTPQLEVNSLTATGPLCVSRIQTQSLNSEEVNCSRLCSDTVDLPSVPPPSFYHLSSPGDVKPGSEQDICIKTEETGERENESACPPEFLDSVHNLMGYVDSTNHLKSSHVAEKIVDKQFNVMESNPTSELTNSIQRDASMGTPSAPLRPPRNAPLNNLNQESTRNDDGEKETEGIKITQQFAISREPPAPTPISVITSEPVSEQKAEENIVRGSYTLPYSYASPQSPPLTRTSSTKSSQPRSTDATPKSPTATISRAESQAYGQTRDSQGDVLNVKISIPVERGSTGQSIIGTRPPQPAPRSHGLSSPTRLQDSASSQADSSKGDAPKQPVTREIKPSTPSTSPAPPPPAPQQLPQQRADSEESMFNASVRLGRAVLRFTMRSLQAVADYIDTTSPDDPGKAEQKRANLQVLLCLLMILVVGLILATTRSGPYISPKWEFLMPPDLPDL